MLAALGLDKYDAYVLGERFKSISPLKPGGRRRKGDKPVQSPIATLQLPRSPQHRLHGKSGIPCSSVLRVACRSAVPAQLSDAQFI
jgi:hypothetical protein